MKRKPPSYWSLREDILLIDHRARGDHPKQIAAALARTQASVSCRLQYHNAATVVNAQRVQREKSYGRRHRPEPAKITIDPVLCPSIVAAWDQHLEAQRRRDADLTAAICGDPPPGRSALDRRNQNGAGA